MNNMSRVRQHDRYIILQNKAVLPKRCYCCNQPAEIKVDFNVRFYNGLKSLYPLGVYCLIAINQNHIQRLFSIDLEPYLLWSLFVALAHIPYKMAKSFSSLHFEAFLCAKHQMLRKTAFFGTGMCLLLMVVVWGNGVVMERYLIASLVSFALVVFILLLDMWRPYARVAKNKPENYDVLNVEKNPTVLSISKNEVYYVLGAGQAFLESLPKQDDTGNVWHNTWIAFGSNQDNPIEQLVTARARLCAEGDLKEIQASPVFLTPPWGYEDQADFYNAVIAYRTTLTPEKLLEKLQSVECEQQRVRTFKNAPRTLDLDILLYDDLTLTSKKLTIPHSLMGERAFVLEPLATLSPNLWIPQQGKVCDLLAKLDCSQQSRLTLPKWHS